MPGKRSQEAPPRIGDVWELLDEEAPAAPAGPAAPRGWKSVLPWAAAGVLALALGALAVVHFREQAPDLPKPVRFQLAPENVTIASSMRFALSPDGTKLAYMATGSDGLAHLWIRGLDSLESRALPATEVSANVPIFWSYDSRFVVYNTVGKLKKIDVTGGPAQTLCDVTGVPVGGSWNQDGVILFGSGTNGPLMRVASEGGMAVPATTIDLSREERAHFGPVFLPDGRNFLHFRQGKPESTGIYLGSLDDKTGQQPAKRLLAAEYTAEFVPSLDGRSGQILFLREGTLFAQPFDLRRLELTGEPVPVAERIANFLTVGQFSASKTGALVYRTGDSAEGLRLTWFDRQGKILVAPSDPAYSNSTVSLSPDCSRVAAVRVDGSVRNVWLLDFARGGPHEAKTRLTYSQNDQYAAWSPDGNQIAFSSTRRGRYDLYRHATNGAGEDEPVFKSDHDKAVDDWSRDGRFLLYEEVAPKTIRDLWVLPMDESAGERKPIPFLQSEFNELEGRFSPDGRWIAYRSNESGRNEIYVRPFPRPAGGGGKWMISQGGGYQPRWRRDGRELFYQTLDGQMMAAEVSASGAAFQPGVSRPLFKTGAALTSAWEVSADGTRLLIPVTGVSETSQAPFTVVLSWMAGLKR